VHRLKALIEQKTFMNPHSNRRGAQDFLAARMGVGRGGLAPLDFEIIGKKSCFFNFEG